MTNHLSVPPVSPFCVGRPLHSHEPIFGRTEAFGFIAAQLASFRSVNLIGAPGLGKTSLCHHLVDNAEQYLHAQPVLPPLVLTYLSCQDTMPRAERFYGLALRELLAYPLLHQDNRAPQLVRLHQQLVHRPETDYNEFRYVLRQLHDLSGVWIRPVFVVDDIECLFDASVSAHFPLSVFFDRLGHLIQKELLAMVVVSRRPLSEYFGDPGRPGVLFSAFPRYCIPYTLIPLERADADALLLQLGYETLTFRYTLTTRELDIAWNWAGGHPGYLQAAGQVWYEAKQGHHSSIWARERFKDLKRTVHTPEMVESSGAGTEVARIRLAWWRRTLGSLINRFRRSLY